MTIYIEDSAKEIELKQLQKTLTLNSATKKVNFVSKEEASKRHANEIGEEFDLTRERVRQIKEKAIQRLRHRSRSKNLRRYLG